MFSAKHIDAQKNVVKELVKGILDGLEMENYDLKIDLVPTLCQVIVRLSEKNSVTFLRAVSKEVRQCFQEYDHIFIKFEYQGKSIYRVSADGWVKEEAAESWNK